MINSLQPKILDESHSAYKTVEELKEVLDVSLTNHSVKNIALTGPFGSGKSSILLTLQKECNRRFHFLPISLGTLEVKRNQDSNNSQSSYPTEVDEDSLNRKIEYSILQQIIYRETIDNVPQSRFRKIRHLCKEDLNKYSLLTVGFVIAFFIAFEPSWLRVETFYKIFDLGNLNVVFDLAAVAYMLSYLAVVIYHLFSNLLNVRATKFNLKDASIEFEGEQSIFNKHLDEILYFFQVTKYNVVIIEDLDRFNTSKIFLKLRELNLLLNQSKIVGRDIIFLYAVKDDIFADEERTKFFDYITTVIPVINSYNSKDILKTEIEKIDKKEKLNITDNEFADIAFFIQDMRILTNIVNEFSQYKQKLFRNKHQLSCTKLLAMITYKNYFPDDFIKLHNRKGLVYNCLAGKKIFRDIVLQKKKDELSDIQSKLDHYRNCQPLAEQTIRTIFLNHLIKCMRIPYSDFQGFVIENESKDIQTISSNQSLFNKLIENSTVTVFYKKTHDYYSQSKQQVINFRDEAERIGFPTDFTFLNYKFQDLIQEKNSIQETIRLINRLPLHSLLNQHKACFDELKKFQLAPLMQQFILRGYIAEDYHDYISYFYEGMITEADRELLLSMKQREAKNYSYEIDQVENFVNELQNYMFDDDAILNNDLVNFLNETHQKGHKKFLQYNEKFEQLMTRFKRDEIPMAFLAQYCANNKEFKPIFQSLFEWNKTKFWSSILNWENVEEQHSLVSAWLLSSERIEDDQVSWLNDHFEFVEYFRAYSDDEKCFELIKSCQFESLNNNDSKLLDFVIQNNLYSINPENLSVICNHLNVSSISLTGVRSTNHDVFISNVEKNIGVAAPILFHSNNKNENPESIVFILNNPDIDLQLKTTYLTGQKNLIDNFDLVDESRVDLAYQAFLISPSLENVLHYFHREKCNEKILNDYINHYHIELSKQVSSNENSDDLDLFAYLVNINLPLDVYKNIISSFDYVIKGHKLDKLDHEHLQFLLEAEKLPFISENTSLLKGTVIYSKYLTKNIEKFLQSDDFSTFLNTEAMKDLLLSNSLTIVQKKRIISEAPESLLEDSDVADVALTEIVKTQDFDGIEPSTIKTILISSQNQRNRLLGFTHSIPKLTKNDCELILSSLGKEYKELVSNGASKISINRQNEDLLKALKKHKQIPLTYKKQGQIWRVELTK